MDNQEANQLHWPYNVLEKKAWYQWVRFLTFVLIAPAAGIWLLATGQCEKWMDYAAACLLIAVGVTMWIGVAQALVRRRRARDAVKSD